MRNSIIFSLTVVTGTGLHQGSNLTERIAVITKIEAGTLVSYSYKMRQLPSLKHTVPLEGFQHMQWKEFLINRGVNQNTWSLMPSHYSVQRDSFALTSNPFDRRNHLWHCHSSRNNDLYAFSYRQIWPYDFLRAHQEDITNI